MSHQSTSGVVFVFAFLVTAVACADVEPTASDRTGMQGGASQAKVGHTLARSETPDDEYLELNDRLPGFGGLFFDESGAPNVFLLDPTEREAAVVALAGYFGRAGSGQHAQALASRVVTHQGAHTFRALTEYRQQFMRGMPRGVTSLDVDDRLNRFVIGIETAELEQAVRSEVARHGIPSEAILTVVEKRPELMVTLQQQASPSKIAGYQISSATTDVCTLGALAFDGADSTHMYFVTASHCTDAPFAVTGDWVGQPLESDTVGYEIWDPPLFTNATDPDCPVYNPQVSVLWPVKCRYSDAALFMGVSGLNPAWHGTIAGTLMNDITQTDSWSITGQFTIAGVGQSIRKVGRTTGTTAGTVVEMCKHVWHTAPSGYDVWMLCQGGAAMSSDGGDSGGPVYMDDEWSSGYGYYHPVMLQGLLWGRRITSTTPPYTTDGSYAYYSLTPMVFDELRAGLPNWQLRFTRGPL